MNIAKIHTLQCNEAERLAREFENGTRVGQLKSELVRSMARMVTVKRCIAMLRGAGDNPVLAKKIAESEDELEENRLRARKAGGLLDACGVTPLSLAKEFSWCRYAKPMLREAAEMLRGDEI